MGVSYRSTSGFSFTNPLLLTIEIYCYEQWVYEGESTEAWHRPVEVKTWN